MVNVLTNELFANTIRSCGAGKNTYTISPEGRIYYCPGFYYKFPDEYLGDVEGGFLNAFDYHLDMNKAPLCKECQIRHCSRCVYKNKQGTGELSIPTEIQCIISHLEYDYSFRLSSILKTQSIDISRKYRTDLNRIDVFDPLYRITGSEYPNHGLNDFTKTIYDL